MSDRRFRRYPVNLRLSLKQPAAELETTTEEIGLGGFSAPCLPLPEVGQRFEFTLHLPDGAQVLGSAAVVRHTPEGTVGFSLECAPASQPTWQAFVQQEQSSGGLWRMLRRYALSRGQDTQAARSVMEQGPLGAVFKRAGVEGSPEGPRMLRLHMVGENGEAYRVAFEKHQGLTPEQSAVVNATMGLLGFARRTVARVLPGEVFLKRSPQGPVEPVQLVELLKGGYAIVSLPPGKPPALIGLHGSELVAVEVDGQSIYPFYDAADLDRIALDTFRRDEPEAQAPDVPMLAVPLREERFSDAYEHKDVAPTGNTQRDLREAMAVTPQRVQSRTYGERTLKLFPDLWVELRRPAAWKGPVRGFAMQDGVELCVFVLDGPGAPRVVRLEPADALSIIRGSA